MPKVFITSAVRTPIGKFKGSFSQLSAVDLGSLAIHQSLIRSHLQPDDVLEVIMGQTLQAGCGQNPARQAALKAGCPETTPAVTVNQVCGSGLRSIAMGYQSVMLDGDQIVVCGGQESMTNSPHCIKMRAGCSMGDQTLKDIMMEDGLSCKICDQKMGWTAENIAQKYEISREDQDKFAYNSHLKAHKAQTDFKFKDETIGMSELCTNEQIRSNISLERLAKLKVIFTEGRKAEMCTVTAGNSCSINDGSSAVTLMSEENCLKRNLKPLAEIVSWSQVGVSPEIMGMGPVEAVKKALKKANWMVGEVDLFEINEAFASQSLACIRELGLDEEKVNVNGGAIALGHPIGCSGCRIVVTLVHEMNRRKGSQKGVAAICVGGGMGLAVCLEKRG